jgi:hypothetical protein
MVAEGPIWNLCAGALHKLARVTHLGRRHCRLHVQPHIVSEHLSSVTVGHKRLNVNGLFYQYRPKSRELGQLLGWEKVAG